MTVQRDPCEDYNGEWYCSEPMDHPHGEHRAYEHHDSDNPLLEAWPVVYDTWNDVPDGKVVIAGSGMGHFYKGPDPLYTHPGGAWVPSGGVHLQTQHAPFTLDKYQDHTSNRTGGVPVIHTTKEDIMTSKFTIGQTVYANADKVFEGADRDGYVNESFDTSRPLTVRAGRAYTGNVYVEDANGLKQYVHESFLSAVPRGTADITGMTVEEKAAIIALAERLKDTCMVEGFEFATDGRDPVEGDLVLILDNPTFYGIRRGAETPVLRHIGQVVKVTDSQDGDGDLRVENLDGEYLSYVYKGSVRKVIRSGQLSIPEGYKVSTKTGRIQRGEFLLIGNDPKRGGGYGAVSRSVSERVGQVVKAEATEDYDGEVYLETLSGEGLGYILAEKVIRLEKEFSLVKLSKARDTRRGQDVILLSDKTDYDGEVRVLCPDGSNRYTHRTNLTFAEGHEAQEPVI